MPLSSSSPPEPPASSPDLPAGHRASDRIPTRLTVEDGRVRVGWTTLRELRFTDPFFEDTTRRARAYPENRTPADTDADVLLALAGDLAEPAPAALLFHVSRCGSTLLSQQLALDDRCIVLSEAPVLDQALRLHLRHPGVVSAATGEALFGAVLRFLARRRFPAETHVFLKCDSWHLHFHDRIRRVLPRSPSVLLHREPAAVLASHRRQPGMHAVPGLVEPEVFGLDAEERRVVLPLPHLDTVLRTYYERIGSILRDDPLAHGLAYVPDGLALFARFQALVGYEPPAALVGRLAERTRFHAKRPSQAFEEPTLPGAPVPVSERTLAAYRALRTAGPREAG